eukprot:6188694-Pleurochrysis_carterae.AAC.3
MLSSSLSNLPVLSPVGRRQTSKRYDCIAIVLLGYTQDVVHVLVGAFACVCRRNSPRAAPAHVETFTSAGAS